MSDLKTSKSSGVVPLKNSLKSKQKVKQIFNELRLFLENTYGEDIKDLKLSLELLEHICNKVEFLVKKEYNINKMDFVISFFDLVFNLTEQEKEILKENIEYLINNKVVLKFSTIYRLSLKTYNYIKKKVC